MAILDVRELSAGYGDGYVVHDVSLKAAVGEFVAILGPNGSGKSTLIRAVQGLLTDVRGRVLIAGEDVSRLGRREIAKRVAYVPQLSEPVFDFTAAEIVRMGRYAHQGRLESFSARDEAAVAEAMAMTEAEELAGRKMARLSGGERQRVFIARALAQDTPLLLLDEPSLHLDINYQVEVYAILSLLRRKRGKTILAAEHNINLAAAHADRLVFLRDGEVAAGGPPAETITAETIRTIFGAEVDVHGNSRSGLPEISLITAAQRDPK